MAAEKTDAMTLILSHDRVELIKEALDTQVRLLKSYINRDDKLEYRIAHFETVQHDIEEALLQQ